MVSTNARQIVLWFARMILVCVLLLDVLFAVKLINVYRRAGAEGLRTFISFYHISGQWHHLSTEELIREAQRGYEGFALICLGLVLLTWVGFWSHRRLKGG